MIRNAFSIVLIILALCSIYFGAYLPLRKAQLYISALNEVRNVRTMEGFREMFLKAFAFYSPIGDEEMAKFFGNIKAFSNFLRQILLLQAHLVHQVWSFYLQKYGI